MDQISGIARLERELSEAQLRALKAEAEVERLRETLATSDRVKNGALDEVERLRAALEHIANQPTYLAGNPYSSLARRALEEK